MGADLEAALELVRQNGYVAIKEKSYRQAQERQRVAEAMRAYAEDIERRTMAWALHNCEEERRLRDRLTAVFSAAALLGVSAAQLSDAAESIIPTADRLLVGAGSVPDGQETAQ